MMAFAASAPVPGSYNALALTNRSARPAFFTSRRPPTSDTLVVPSMSATTESDIRIRLTGNNIKITSALREYVEKKIGKVVTKYSGYCSKVDVHLTCQPSVPQGQAAEVVIFYKKNIFRRLVRSEDMYASIDMVEEMIDRTLRKFKERKEGQAHKSGVADDVGAGVFVDVPEASDSDMDDLADSYASSPDMSAMLPKIDGLVKRKTFPLPLQTVEEAIMCLDYIDHSFYMFRLADTGKVSLVYRRNHGGFGLIEPDSDDE